MHGLLLLNFYNLKFLKGSLKFKLKKLHIIHTEQVCLHKIIRIKPNHPSKLFLKKVILKIFFLELNFILNAISYN